MRSIGCTKWAELGGFSLVARETDRDKGESLKEDEQKACGVIRSCLSQDLKYDVMNETSAKKISETLASKYLMKSIENRLQLKRRLYHF